MTKYTPNQLSQSKPKHSSLTKSKLNHSAQREFKTDWKVLESCATSSQLLMVLIQPADNLENRSEPSLVLRPGHAEELEQKVYFIKSWAFERFLRYCADSSNSIREKQCEFSRYPIYCVYVTTVQWCEAQRTFLKWRKSAIKRKQARAHLWL